MFPSIGRHKQCWKSPSSAGLALCHRSQRCKVPNGHLGGFKGASRTGDAQLRSYYGITCVDSAAVIIVIVIIIIIIIILVSIASTSCNLIFRLPSFKQNHRLLANLEIAVHSMHVASDFYMPHYIHTLPTYTYIQHMHYRGTYVLSKWAAYRYSIDLCLRPLHPKEPSTHRVSAVVQGDLLLCSKPHRSDSNPGNDRQWSQQNMASANGENLGVLFAYASSSVLTHPGWCLANTPTNDCVSTQCAKSKLCDAWCQQQVLYN